MRHAHRAVLAALAVLVALSAAAVVGCGGREDASPPAGAAPSGAADITGVVRTLSLSPDDGSAVMLVIADPAVPGVVDRASVRVSADARIWTQDGDGRRALSIADLAVGRLVAVWFSGPVAESYPVQADAGDVQVLAPPPGD